MGLAISTSVATNIITATNNTMQTAKNTCNADCNQSINGPIIVLNNSTVGNIQFTQKCTANASCYMKNALDQIVTAAQKADSGTAAAPSLFPGIQINTSVSTNVESFRNEVQQVLENICQGKVDQNINNPIIYATDSTAQNIGFLQEGNAFASCVMENSARIQLNLQQEGTATAKTGAATSLLGGIIGIIIVVVIIIIVAGMIKKKQTDSAAVGPDGKPLGPDGKPLPGGLPPVIGPNGKPVVPISSSTTSRVVARPAVPTRPAVATRTTTTTSRPIVARPVVARPVIRR
jgi:hypothetical protein